MQTIILLSTVHKEIGNCNSNELLKIIENIRPDVIFLEALEKEYSTYDRMLFSQFEQYKERLEIKTLQNYMQNYSFEYVPVLDRGISDEFEKFVEFVAENDEHKRLMDNYTLMEMEGGFRFLNSNQSIKLHEEMRELANQIVGDKTLLQKANTSIDEYENTMLRNIYSYCNEKSFKTAIFMCGSAHRKSVIEKTRNYNQNISIEPKWVAFNESY